MNKRESYDGNYSEGEEELHKIEGTLGGIDTSSEFFDEEHQSSFQTTLLGICQTF